MKIKVALIILILFFTQVVYAERLEGGESTTVSGKTITAKHIDEDKVLFDVDGIRDTISNGSGGVINGVEITVNDINAVFDPPSVDISIEIVATCGDNACNEDYEDQRICCADCGCLNNKTDICLDNICINAALNQCLSDVECDDNNKTTLDGCSGVPRKCSHKLYACSENEVGVCNDDDPETSDECISGLCKFTPYKELAKCSTNEECDDNNVCSSDSCEGLPKACANKEIKTCKDNDGCCPSRCKTDKDNDCSEEAIKESWKKSEKPYEERGFFGKILYLIKKILTF